MPQTTTKIKEYKETFMGLISCIYTHFLVVVVHCGIACICFVQRNLLFFLFFSFFFSFFFSYCQQYFSRLCTHFVVIINDKMCAKPGEILLTIRERKKKKTQISLDKADTGNTCRFWRPTTHLDQYCGTRSIILRADGQDRDGECSGAAGWDEIDKTVQHCLSGVEVAVHWCSEIPLFTRNRKMLT